MELAAVIAQRIPAAMLERIVFDQNVVGEGARVRLFKASGLSADEIAQEVVAAYGTEKARLAYGLYEQVHRTDWNTATLLYEHFRSNPAGYLDNHQASLVGRIPDLPIDELSEFLATVKRQVCLITTRRGNTGAVRRGTGFLVGPDMVLTCRHVLKGLEPDEAVAANGSRIEVFFDFYRGERVEDIEPVLPHARRVSIAPQWHIVSCEDTQPDGMPDPLEPPDAERIAQSLDFVLLRLSEPIGLQPLEQGGGWRRGWIALPTDDVPRSLQVDDWIIIPQHPSGFPLRIDLGRFRNSDQTGTRIRYSTNTAPGSSGAPCFNQKFVLVGLHNAFVGPEQTPLANQAIRFDHIASHVRLHAIAAATARAPRWSVARDGEEPRVILGRTTLLDWLQRSTAARPEALADRVYVAAASAPGAGCSFSLDVLHAEIRDTRTPRAVYGTRGQQLPATVEDFLVSLLREIGIVLEPSRPEDRPPTRPSTNLATSTVPAVGEVDKLQRWISHDLPEWLGNVITRSVEKELDGRDAARQAIEIYDRAGLPAPPELAATAARTEPVLMRPNAWDFAYVAIDELRTRDYAGASPRTELAGEVRDLIAALVKGQAEEAMNAGLKRLRWLFLGYLPDFLPPADGEGNGATLEVLDPAAFGENEVLGVVDRMAETHIRMRAPRFVNRAWARVMVSLVDDQGVPASRLASLQNATNMLSTDLLQEDESLT